MKLIGKPCLNYFCNAVWPPKINKNISIAPLVSPNSCIRAHFWLVLQRSKKTNHLVFDNNKRVGKQIKLAFPPFFSQFAILRFYIRSTIPGDALPYSNFTLISFSTSINLTLPQTHWK